MSIPATRKAIGFKQTGDFDVLEIIELPLTPAPDQIVVKGVRAFTTKEPLNLIPYGPTNNLIAAPTFGLYSVPVPYAIGSETAGTIVALPTDPAVLNDPEYKKRNFTVGARVSASGSGLLADYSAVPWNNVVVLPDNVSTRVAGGARAQGLTALTFISESYNVKKGDTILVHTVAGGLGLLFAQLIKARGATVIGTTSTKEKAEIAKANGADHVILYKDEDTVQRVLEITNGVGVDAVFDGVGKDTFDSNFKMLKRKGTLVSVGNASGAVPPFPPIRLVEKNLVLLRPTVGNYLVTPQEMHYYTTEFFKLISEGTLNILIHKEYEFTREDAIQAQKDLVSGNSVGKLIVKLP
ncbi:NAD(P)-binding protein [Mycena kentingensis (nom. inval.)]|nr:NAD(P)-binding protein [Mycena kentingensis (nom. inval.)]